MKNLLNKIKTKNVNILIIGLGYVGLPLLKNISKKGFNVSGLDNNKNLIKNLKKRIKKNLFFSSYDKIDFNKVDIIILALPTPVDNKKKPNLFYIRSCINSIFPKLSKNKLIILESTSYPTTTEELIVSKFKKKFKIGKNFFIGYSPEREDPGNKDFNIKNIPKIVSGMTDKCKFLVETFYSKICDSVVKSSSIEVAEMSKLYENIFRAVNISLSNETKEICKKINIEFNEVLELASTKPFGFMPFKPGPGVGGHCIPVDPFYLNWFLKKKNMSSKFIELSGKINSEMPKKVARQIELILRKNNYKSKDKILFLGLAYKKNIDDLRNSPSLEIFKHFYSKKYNIYYNDNFIPYIKIKKKKIYSQKMNSKGYKVVVLLTDHDYYKRVKLKNKNQIVIDSRFFYKNIKNAYFV